MFDTGRLKDFPSLPGVYVMSKASKGEGEILYVGKAKNLKARVKQYFAKGGDGRAIIPFLISEIEQIDFTVVASEKEALILENTLIKKYRPKYNALLKDDRSFVALKVRTSHPWPIVEIVRSKAKSKNDGLYFGPYPNAYAARQTLELLQRLFPLRQCSDQELLRRTRPCILHEMKRCIAPCVNLCTHAEYDRFVQGTIKFLRGQAQEVIAPLTRAMEEAAERLEFEQAQTLLSTIRQIEATLEKQKAYKMLGGDVDALALYRRGDEVILSQVVVQEGKLQGAFHHSFNQIAEEDHELYTSFILQHYLPRKERPREILLPCTLQEAAALEEILAIKLHVPERGEKKGLVAMAQVNAESTFNKEKDIQNLREKSLAELQERLHLIRYPFLIECFDNSNLSGTEPVSAVVAFKDGVRDPSRFRKFKIKSAEASDDYGMMHEVLTRRYKRAKEEGDLPDLIIIDGGKGHLNVALKVLDALEIATADVIGIAKEEGRHDRGLTQEQIFLKDHSNPLRLQPHSAALYLLQKIRDEAHRAAIGYQKKRRSKALIRSALDVIPGIGPAKKKALLTHFKSVAAIAKASQEELCQVKGITPPLAHKILSDLRL